MSQEISPLAPELMGLPAESPQMNHGRTVAGWFLFWVASLGALITGIGAVINNAVTIGVGAGVMVLGLVVSGVLRVMGHGQPRKKSAVPTVEDL